MRAKSAKFSGQSFRVYKNALPPKAYIADADTAKILYATMEAEAIEDEFDDLMAARYDRTPEWASYVADLRDGLSNWDVYLAALVREIDLNKLDA